MAEGKKSFVLYCDIIHTVEYLTDEQSGKLLKQILKYVNDQNPVSDDPIINLAFEPIKQQLKRDLKAWQSERKQRSKSGRKGGIKSGEARRSKTKQNEGVLQKSKQNEANEAVTVNVTDTVTVNVNVIELFEIEIGATIEFCSYGYKREYDKKRIVELWQAFLINGQEKYYATREKKIQHFRNWIKKQPYDSHKQNHTDSIKRNGNARAGKSEGANNLLEIIRQDHERSGGKDS